MVVERTLKHVEQLRRTHDDFTWPMVIPMSGSAPIVLHRSLRHLPQKRLTALGQWQNDVVVVKLFFAKKRWRIHGQREWRGLMALKAAQIETPALLYAGLSGIPSLFVVVTRYVPDAASLRQKLMPTGGEPILTDLSQTVLMLAKLHDQGLLQQDVHLDNFLLSPNNTLFVIDGAEVITQKKPLSRTVGKRHLARLLAQCVPYHQQWASPALMLYHEARGFVLNHNDATRFANSVATQVKKRQQLCLNKIFRNCTAFWVQHGWRRYGVAARAMQGLLGNDRVTHAPVAWDSALANEANLLKKGRSSTVGRLFLDQHGETVVKRYNLKSFWHAVSRAWRPSRAWRTWYNAHCLIFWGIATPTPLAMVEKRWGLFRRQAYYVSAYVDGIPLDRYFAAQPTVTAASHAVIAEVRALFLRLQQARLSHGDLKASNLLLAAKKDALAGELLLLDLDAMHWHACDFSLRRAWRADLTRFLKNWDDHPHLKNAMMDGLRNLPIGSGSR